MGKRTWIWSSIYSIMREIDLAFDKVLFFYGYKNSTNYWGKNSCRGKKTGLLSQCGKSTGHRGKLVKETKDMASISSFLLNKFIFVKKKKRKKLLYFWASLLNHKVTCLLLFCYHLIYYKHLISVNKSCGQAPSAAGDLGSSAIELNFTSL